MPNHGSNHTDVYPRRRRPASKAPRLAPIIEEEEVPELVDLVTQSDSSASSTGTVMTYRGWANAQEAMWTLAYERRKLRDRKRALRAAPLPSLAPPPRTYPSSSSSEEEATSRANTGAAEDTEETTNAKPDPLATPMSREVKQNLITNLEELESSGRAAARPSPAPPSAQLPRLAALRRAADKKEKAASDKRKRETSSSSADESDSPKGQPLLDRLRRIVREKGEARKSPSKRRHHFQVYQDDAPPAQLPGPSSGLVQGRDPLGQVHNRDPAEMPRLIPRRTKEDPLPVPHGTRLSWWCSRHGVRDADMLNKYKKRVDFICLCNFCAVDTAVLHPDGRIRRHYRKHDCPRFLAFVARMQPSSSMENTAALQPFCDYPPCTNKQGHLVAACNTLHRLCRGGCNKRGHPHGGCAIGEAAQAAQRQLFDRFSPRGRFTRRRGDWGYDGPSVPSSNLRYCRALTNGAFIPWSGNRPFAEDLPAAAQAARIRSLLRE